MFTGNRNYFRGRNGIAMIMAIVVIVVISTIMALSISLSTQTSKRTTDIYLYEQAVLYSKSAAELALLDIAQNPPCSVTAKNISFDNTYDANITMKYIYTSPSPCSNANDNYFSITTPEQNGSVMMDITVSTDAGTEPITYFRRTIQKL
ncbi:MAG: hypothetical protein JXQ66_06455 [Campylobacterales bacterium]|nr:hypothetical protein [Campylobacterales bacterium]